MFCSNCGNRLEDGAKFCSACGNRVQPAADQESRFGGDIVFSEPKRDTGLVPEPEDKPASRMESVSFDWSAVVDEPHRKEVRNVKSPWESTGGFDEKELYAEMTPSTDRSRTMSFIDVLKAEKEEKERRSEERAFVYTDVLEVEPDMSSFDNAPTLTYAPLYDDVDAPVKTPFDDSRRKPEKNTYGNAGEPAVETSRETLAQFDEYVKSFEAGAGIIHDEPRFEKPAPSKPVNDEPKFEFPDFLKRAAARSGEEPEFDAAADAAVSLEELSDSEGIDFRKDIMDEPTFEVPKIRENQVAEPVFEEPKYEEPVFEEPAFEEPKYDEGDFDDGFDEYLELDTTGDEEPVDEKALFAEMEADRPAKTGMTIAAPADREEEIAALKKTLMELTGMEVRLDSADGKHAENNAPAPETTADIDGASQNLSAASETKEETDKAAADNPEDLYLGIKEPVQTPEPELLVLDDIKPESEPAPAPAPVQASTENDPFFIGEVTHTPAPAPAAEEPAAIVLEDISPAPTPAAAPAHAPAAEGPAPVVLEDIRQEPTPAPAPAAEDPFRIVLEDISPEPAPAPTPAAAPAAEAPAPVAEAPVQIVLEDISPAPTPAAAPAPAEAPKEVKSSDALSLEDLEKDLFGETPTAEVEAEETKKIDKFYTLYRKNEEFQRLLDEEYDKLKGEGADGTAKPADEKQAGAAAAPAAEIPAEQSKAYRQVEDETIYKAFEIPPELVKEPPKEVDEGAGVKVVKAPPAEVPVDGAAFAADGNKPAVSGKKASREDKKAAREAAKAEKARQKQEKKALKAKAKADPSAAGVEYEEVDTGSGFLTVLAVIIAVILVILLAVILILQVAPDSGIAIAIDTLIENLTGGISAVDPGNGPFLL